MLYAYTYMQSHFYMYANINYWNRQGHVYISILSILLVIFTKLAFIVSCQFINSLKLSDTYICACKLTIIGSDNGLSPVRCQAIIWIKAGILLIGPPGTNFNGILFKIHTFSLKMSSAKWLRLCRCLNGLITWSMSSLSTRSALRCERVIDTSWWRHKIEELSALLAPVFCAGNSPVTGEFPSLRSVTRKFDVSFE